MNGQQVAGWVFLSLSSAGLIALAVGIYYWKKQQLDKQQQNASAAGRSNFEAMNSSELNRAGNMRHMMQAPGGANLSSSGYDAPIEVSQFQPQNASAMSLKVDDQMTAAANSSLFENPYFADRNFEFPKIARQSSGDVFADESIEIDESYDDGIVRLKGITSTESFDHDPHHPKPMMTSSTDYMTSELVLADDEADNAGMYIEGKLDLQGITTSESSDDPKEPTKLNVVPKRRISAGSLKFDQDMQNARRLSADVQGFLPDNIALQLAQSQPDIDNDLVIVTRSDLDNGDSPKISSGELSPSFETIDVPSISVTGEERDTASGGATLLDRLNFKGFIKDENETSQSSSSPQMSGLDNPLFVDISGVATHEVDTLSPSGNGGPISDTSLGSDISVISPDNNGLGGLSDC